MSLQFHGARAILRALPLILAVLMLSSCGGDDPASPDPGATNGEVAQVIIDAGKVVPGTEYNTTEPGGAPTLSDDGETRYIKTLHHQSENVKDILDLGINESLIWPGQLIYGEGAASFFYDDIQIARGPVTISLNLEGTPGNENLSKTVDDPKLSTMRGGISELLAGVGSVPAAANFSKEFVYTKEQLNLAMSANASVGTVDIASKFDFSTSSTKTKMVAKYQQVYFSVDIDRPTSPASFIKSGTPLADVQAAFPAGSLPMYVAGVKYGWMAVMVIESSESEEATAAALDASYSGLYDVQVTASMTAEELLRSSKLEAYVYGGSTAALGELYTGFDGFVQVIQASANFGPTTPGIPLVYTFANMADNTNAVINMAADYVTNTPIRLREHLLVTLESYQCTYADDGVGDSTLEIDRLWTYANPFNKASDASSNIFPAAQAVAYYTSGGDGWRAYDGALWTWTDANKLDITFNTDPDLGYDFNTAKIDFTGYGRDYDSSSGNEDGSGALTLTGNHFFDDNGRGPGKHQMTIHSGGNFTILANIKIERQP